jgi:hypothetical protein
VRAWILSGMRAAGDRLTIDLTRPSPDFLERLSLPFFCVVPAGTPIVAEGVAPAPPTAGPYYMARWDNGNYLILKRNPNYPGPRPHFFDAFIFREGMDTGPAVGRVAQGVWDHVSLDDPLLAPGGATWSSAAVPGSRPSRFRRGLPHGWHRAGWPSTRPRRGLSISARGSTSSASACAAIRTASCSSSRAKRLSRGSGNGLRGSSARSAGPTSRRYWPRSSRSRGAGAPTTGRWCRPGCSPP